MGRAFIARASAGKAGRHTHTVVHVCNWTNVQARACNACIHGWDEGETGEAVGGTGKGAGTGVRACMCALMCDTRARRTGVWVGQSKWAYLSVRACTGGILPPLPTRSPFRPHLHLIALLLACRAN